MLKRINIPSSVVRNAIILLLAIGVVTAVRFSPTLPSGRAAPADSSSQNIYLGMVSNNESADFIIGKYHDAVNKMFNEKIKKLVAKITDSKKISDFAPLLAPPIFRKDNPAKREDCKGDGDGENLSTYCLSRIAAHEYFNFYDALQAARTRAKDELQVKVDKLSGGQSTGATAFQQRSIYGSFSDLVQGQNTIQAYGEKVNKIDREIETSKQALDLALATYNELQMALPLHRKYMDIIKVLEGYRDRISKVRKQIEQYPQTFMDVTTTSCT